MKSLILLIPFSDTSSNEMPITSLTNSFPILSPTTDFITADIILATTLIFSSPCVFIFVVITLHLSFIKY